MAEVAIRHEDVRLNGIRLHVARAGQGRPLLLLHGWPEFWLTWERVMRRLGGRGFALIAPDLRGFGDSDKPDLGRSDRAGAEVHAADMLALLDVLGIAHAGVVAHDVGAMVAQLMALREPARLTGLFFFDCPYPGIGRRWVEPAHLKEIWYQFFHQKDFAAALVGSSREACRLYLSHFLRHWSGGNPGAFDDVLEAWVDNFMKPGNLQGGFNWYISNNAARMRIIRGEAPPQPPIAVPTCVRWGDRDPVLPSAWIEGMEEYFADLDAKPFEGLGHFPHMEDPDRAAGEIAAFFDRVMPAGRGGGAAS